MCVIRLLKAEEIDVRIGQVTKDGKRAMILLYKDARCDMSILDEVYGSLNWKRRHEFKDGKNYCTVSIWDKDKKEWIDKEDMGTESNTEKEKGEASDSFKRACTNVGIGRELYTAPKMWIDLNPDEVQKTDRGCRAYVELKVAKIEYKESREIAAIEIVDNHNRIRFTTYQHTNTNSDTSTTDSSSSNTPQQVKSQISGKKAFNPAWLSDEEGMKRMYQWIERQEEAHNINNPDKKFRPYNLIERTYIASPEEIMTVVQGYENYKLEKSRLL